MDIEEKIRAKHTSTWIKMWELVFICFVGSVATAEAGMVVTGSCLLVITIVLFIATLITGMLFDGQENGLIDL